MEDGSRVYQCLYSAAKSESRCTSSTAKDILIIFNFPGVLEKIKTGPIFTATAPTASDCKASIAHNFLSLPC